MLKVQLLTRRTKEDTYCYDVVSLWVGQNGVIIYVNHNSKVKHPVVFMVRRKAYVIRYKCTLGAGTL